MYSVKSTIIVWKVLIYMYWIIYDPISRFNTRVIVAPVSSQDLDYTCLLLLSFVCRSLRFDRGVFPVVGGYIVDLFCFTF